MMDHRISAAPFAGIFTTAMALWAGIGTVLGPAVRDPNAPPVQQHERSWSEKQEERNHQDIRELTRQNNRVICANAPAMAPYLPGC